MFTPFQHALNKLREVRQSDQSQPKQRIIPTDPPDPPGNASGGAGAGAGAGGVNIDDLNFDLGDTDVFDDLLVDDMGMGNEPPSAAQPQLPPTKPADTTATTPKSVSRLAAFTFAKPAQKDVAPQQQQQQQQPQPQQPSISSQRPSGPQQFNRSQKHTESQLPNKSQVPSEFQASSDDASQQQDSFATPRPGSSSSRAPGHVADFVTTVVNSSKRRALSTGHQRQEIPGPAGLIGAPIPCVIAPTQKPVSAFKTPLSGRAQKEQSSEMDFESGTWAAMLDHLDMPSYKPLTANEVVRTEERAAWPIIRVSALTRTQNVPSMLVQLREIVSSESDASAVVVDPTGEIRASIHHAVMRRVALPLVAGTSIILNNVAVMKMSGWPPFLVITGSMIEQIFTVKSAGTYEGPIVVEDTQKAALFTPTRAPQTTTDDGSVKPRDTPAAPNSDLPADAPTQPVVDLDADEFDDMPEAADDLLGLLKNESFFGDNDDNMDQF
ncbi:hypothetical protein GGI17_000223 [Coemansia sp. S146]|nr:hypothetical protein GGI17_000223 [Coemansia sp. S146]